MQIKYLFRLNALMLSLRSEKIYGGLIPFLSEIILHYKHKVQSLEPALGSGSPFLFQDLGFCKWNGWI